jgi:cephalosporin-C deacetylase-like acetyl esterase
MKKIIITIDGYHAIQSKVLATLSEQKAIEKIREVQDYINYHKETSNMEVDEHLNFINCCCYDDFIKVEVEDTTEMEEECSLSTEEFLLSFDNIS